MPNLSKEDERLEALYRYNILDTQDEADFDDLVRLAAQICDVPIALISLVDRDRLWFKAKLGVESCGMARENSFCAYAVAGQCLIVPDAREDARFANHPVVTGPACFRYYAGYCLLTPDGHKLGTLCVLDRKPRELSTEQLDSLSALARQVMGQMELRRAFTGLEERSQAMRLVLDNVDQGLATIGKDSTLVGARSAAFVQQFGSASGSVGRILGADDPRTAEALDLALGQVYEDILPRELALQQMPARLVRNGLTFELAFKPIQKNGELQGLLLVTTDVTDEVRARQAEAAQREQASIFQHVMRDATGFTEFFAEALGLVDRIRQNEFESADERLRAIHTLKGNVSLFGITSIADVAHRMEQAVLDDNRETYESEKSVLSSNWEPFAARVAALVGTSGSKLELSRAEYERLLAAVQARLPYERLQALVEQLPYEPIHVRLARLSEQITMTSRRLGKGEPVISIAADDVRLPPNWAPRFWSALVHVVRNVVDHGFQSGDDRERLGKPRANHVEIGVRSGSNELVLKIAEDGRGIDWERLREQANAAGLPSETRNDLVAAIFTSGISTAKKLSEVSGRGVGMAEVMEVCRDIGGRIEVESEPDQGTCFSFHFPPIHGDFDASQPHHLERNHRPAGTSSPPH